LGAWLQRAARNAKADAYAKRAARNSREDTPFSRKKQNVANTAFLKWSAAEARRKETTTWIQPRTAKNRAYILLSTRRCREKLRNEDKEDASRYVQFLTGHALTAFYLEEI
jgi:hypothetical protein